MNVRRAGLWMSLLVLCALMQGCGNKSDGAPKPKGPSATLITVVQASQTDFQIWESTVGTVESTIDPKITAEVSGRISQVLGRAGAAVTQGQLLAVIDPDDLRLARQAAAAEANRIRVLLKNQGAVVERHEALVGKNFLSQSALDDAIAQQRVLVQQLEVAKAQLAIADSNIKKTKVLSPFDGKIERPLVAQGDFVKVGDPMFELLSTRVLNVYLPFPESLLPVLKVGQKVKLRSSASGELESEIAEIKAGVGPTNRAVSAIVRLKEQVGWHPGSTVDAAVAVAQRPGAIVVPELSVVLRPAGKVVYVIEGNLAKQRVVTAGVKQQGMVEIISGLKGGETIALDGAGFLTDNAPVNVQSNKPKS